MKHNGPLQTSMLRAGCAVVFFIVVVCCALATHSLAADYVICKRGGKTLHLTGKAVVTASDGGIMLLASDGKLWNIPPAEIVEHRQNEDPFTSLTAEELKKQVLTELPTGFDAYSTAHYVIFYNTSRAYAQWCGALFERLYSAFTNFWTHRGFKLHDPQTPLIVVIYADRQTYAKQSADELGNNAGRVIGFYSLQTNRVKTYDLTGVESLRQAGGKRADSAAINELLSRPEATTMVSTVIHEATHQIAFNCGLQQRFADIPLWLSEGLAMYFETPDLSFGKGWRTIGEVNRPRLERFQQFMQRRPADSLSDADFRRQTLSQTRHRSCARCVCRSLGAQLLSIAAAAQGISGLHRTAGEERTARLGRSGRAAARNSKPASATIWRRSIANSCATWRG